MRAKILPAEQRIDIPSHRGERRLSLTQGIARLDAGDRFGRHWAMNKILLFPFICLLAVLCGSSVRAGTSDAVAVSPLGPFDQLADDFVFGTLALSPTTATGVVYHVHHGA